MWELLLIAAAMGVTGLPLLPAIGKLRNRRDMPPLDILHDHAGDSRDFAARLRSLSAGGAPDGVQILRVDAAGLAAIDVGALAERSVLVVAETCRLPEGSKVAADLHARKSLRTGAGCRLRAVLADAKLTLTAGTIVLHWAHARRIEVETEAAIIGRLSADKAIALDAGCLFHRINAPTIFFGRIPLPTAGDEGEDMVSDGVRIVHARDLALPPGSFTHGNIDVRGCLRVGEGARVAGSVEAYGDTVLGDGAAIDGSLVCGGALAIGAGCRLTGHVIAERPLCVQSGTVIGRRNRPTTLSAPKIRVSEGCVVHGSVWARDGGTVLAESF